MTKADRIRQLAKHEIFSTKEIADIVSREMGACCPEYVRICARQRIPGGRDPAKTWKQKNPDLQRGYVRAYYRRQKAAEAAS